MRAYLGLGDDGAAIDWDSGRREDGRWLVTATVGGRQASWTYDMVGNSVQPLDDDARAWMGLAPVSDPIEDALGLIAETPVVRADAEVETLEGEDARGADRPRLVAVPSIVESDDTPDPEAFDAAAIDAGVVEEEESLGEEANGEVQNVPTTEQPPLPLPQDPASTVVIETAPELAKARKPKPRKGRASVPSWDEILFGARSDD